MKLRPHQDLAVHFLMQDRNRLLGDEQRVGKTAPALVAIQRLKLRKILIICPVSVQYVWKSWAAKMGLDHNVGICNPDAEICIVPWSKIATGALAAKLRGYDWELIIADESHYAKSFSAQRTKALYGNVHGMMLMGAGSLAAKAERVWCLSGTPIPHDPSDLYPMMRALFPETLKAGPGIGDVTAYSDFEARYVVTRPQRVSPFRTIKVKVGGRNEGELGRRLGNRMLRRRQTDIGIRPADHDILPLHISSVGLRQVEGELQMLMDSINYAIDHNSTARLGDLATARVIHLTGQLKAPAVVDAAKDYLEGGSDKLVIAYWHKSVGDILMDGLTKYGPLRVDGATIAPVRAECIERFQNNPAHRVFLGQIAAAGEGIDLSAAPELWFAESVFSPRMMSQMSARITNMNMTRQALVRVCALAGSIDEKIQEALQRLYTSIHLVLEK